MNIIMQIKNAFQVYINDWKKTTLFLWGNSEKFRKRFIIHWHWFGNVKLKVVNDMNKIDENFGT